MARKNNRPTIDEYFGLDAQAYGESKWMARNQIKTTERALFLLKSDHLGSSKFHDIQKCLILDIGAGTGYSSHTILHLGSRVIALDFSRDMLSQCPSDHNLLRIQADMRFVPFRHHQFHHIISISAFNFATEGAKTQIAMKNKIRKVYLQIQSVLKNQGRVIIEFYPTELEQTLFLKIIKNFPFQGGLLIDNPDTRKEKKFLLLQKIAKQK